jgi:PAS domain S-box-containing protein
VADRVLHLNAESLLPPHDLTAEAFYWFANWPDGLVVADPMCNVRYMSAKATELLGWATADVQGRNLHDLLCPHNRDNAHTPGDCPLCGSDPDADEVHSGYWSSRHGVYVSVDYRVMPLAGDFGGRVLSFYDNRQRNHSYREMRKFTEYVELNPAPIAEFDADGQLLFGNPALQEQLLLHGFDDRGIARIWPTNLGALCQRAWCRQTIVNDVEVKVDDNWYRWYFHPVGGGVQDGDTPSVLAYLFDITEQKMAEIQLAEEKAAARRDFFAKMVHELRTPLNAIIGFSQVLMRRLDGVLSERDKASLRAIRAAGIQLNELVSDTLDIAKIEAGKMVLEEDTFTLLSVMESFRDQVTTLADAKNLIYVCECDAALVIRSDFRKVRQILLNLVANAIKYTHEGSIQVRGFLTEPHTLVIEVKDTGIGIAKDHVSKLFRSYEQVSDERNRGIQGTGLGLALVAELVAMLGGSIVVESTLGKGSLFRVTLPVGR